MKTASKTKKAPTIFSIKFAAIVGLLAIFSKDWRGRTWPWGLASPWRDRPQYASIDHSNDSLQTKRKIQYGYAVVTSLRFER